MKDKEILEKAISKAIEDGWKPFEFGEPTSITKWDDKEMIEIAVVFPLHKNPVEWVRELEGIIYNHDFAKALWGEGNINVSKGPFAYTWKYHLQQMVISDDPVKYLGENI